MQALKALTKQVPVILRAPYGCVRFKTTATPWKYSRQKSGPGKYFLLLIPAATFGLGTWQVERRKWKLNLIETMRQKTTAETVPLPLDLEELKDMDYRRVLVRGTFDHSKEMFILPRSPVGDDQSGFGRNMGSQSGANVITPFKLADRDLTILVNRGWVSKFRMDPKERLEGQITNEVEFAGVVRTSENKQAFVAKNEPTNNKWFFRDISAMAEYANSAPIFIDADAKSTVPNGPVGGQTNISIRNEHFSYIVTWYSLCAVTLAMWYVRYFR